MHNYDSTAVKYMHKQWKVVIKACLLLWLYSVKLFGRSHCLFFQSVYTWLLLLLDLARVKMSSNGMMWGSSWVLIMSAMNQKIFTFLVSLHTSSTQFHDYFSSCKQVTNPAIDLEEFYSLSSNSLFSRNIRYQVKTMQENRYLGHQF